MTKLTNDEKIKLYMADRRYDYSICKIVSIPQVSLYTQYNVLPLDMFYNKGTLCFVYNKTETQHLYKQWDATNPNKKKG